MQINKKQIKAIAEAVSVPEKKFFLADFKDYKGYYGWQNDIDAGIEARETVQNILASFGLRYWSGPAYSDGYLRGVHIAIELNCSGPCSTLFENVFEYSPEEIKKWALDVEKAV